MDLRLSLAIFTGKLISLPLKFLGSGATAAPGLYALKIDPNLVKKLTAKNSLRSIIVTGTNGKTTTSRLLYNMLSTKYKVIHNRQGSNLVRGIASTLLGASSVSGKINTDLCLWETDEAVLESTVEQVNPKTILFLNLFRDQLDRYGETNTVRNKWQQALKNAPKSTQVFLNADDPGVAILKKSTTFKPVYFGIESVESELPQTSTVSDVKHCLNCQNKLTFSKEFSSHLGHYYCTKCKEKRPNPQVSASNIKLNSNFSADLKLSVHSERFTLHSSLPGLYNVYNILAASALAKSLSIKESTIITEIEKYQSAFGRFQSVSIANQVAIIFLIKNPTGANEVLRTISTQSNINLLILLNDKLADGTDVSWIWDTNWEILKDKAKNVTVSGIRAFDMALRLKYAGFVNFETENDISSSITRSLSKTEQNEQLIILPTYTALLKIEKLLAKKGSTKWHKQ